MSLAIRPATPDDATLIVSLIGELAEYEKLAHECHATVEGIEHWLFGRAQKAYCLIMEWEGKVAGFVLYFYNFSTFLAKPGLYVEDLFVRPAFRRRGIARQVFAHLAKKALEEGCGRVEWWVLNWNEDALNFYRTLGAVSMDEWTVQRITGPALETLAATA